MRPRLKFKTERVNLSRFYKSKELPIKGRSPKEVQDRIEAKISNDVYHLFRMISIESELKAKLEARNNVSYVEHYRYPKYIYVR
jgi:hypothetical protein